MVADIQSIAVFITLSSVPITDISPPAASRNKVRMAKNVWAAYPAVMYVFFGILWGRKSRNTASLKPRYVMNMPIIARSLMFSSEPFMKPVPKRSNLYVSRQKGRIMAHASRFLSRVSLTLASRLKHSLNLTMHAARDGNKLTVLLSRSIIMIIETVVRISLSISCLSLPCNPYP